jgi:C-terminal peptidase prc
VRAATLAYQPRMWLLGTLLVACTTVGGPAPPSPSSSQPAPPAARPALPPYSAAAFFADVVGIVRGQYVEEIPVAQLGGLALRGLPDVRPRGAIRIVDTTQGAALIHGESGSPEATVSLSWPPHPMADDAGRLLEEAARFVVQRLGARPSEVVDAMMLGLMALDAHGTYYPAAAYTALQTADAGGDVGIQARIRGGSLVVVYAIEGSPGHRAGLRGGDRVLTIDGVSTNGLKMAEATRLLRGPSGSEAVFVVARKQWSEPRRIAVTRAPVPPLGVQRKTLGRIGYVWIPALLEGTAGQVRTAVDALRADGVRALVLDLRSNAGGLLTAAVEVSELFLAERQLVTYTQGRARSQNMRFSAHTTSPTLDLPLAVLVDDGTAAGAEIVAGALQDWARAAVVGTKTTGNTTLQTIIPLANGGGLRLTTARWFTPKGRSLARLGGLTPDVAVLGGDDAEFSGDPQRDAQLRRAVEVLEAKTAP